MLNQSTTQFDRDTRIRLIQYSSTELDERNRPFSSDWLSNITTFQLVNQKIHMTRRNVNAR